MSTPPGRNDKDNEDAEQLVRFRGYLLEAIEEFQEALETGEVEEESMTALTSTGGVIQDLISDEQERHVLEEMRQAVFSALDADSLEAPYLDRIQTPLAWLTNHYLTLMPEWFEPLESGAG